MSEQINSVTDHEQDRQIRASMKTRDKARDLALREKNRIESMRFLEKRGRAGIVSVIVVVASAIVASFLLFN